MKSGVILLLFSASIIMFAWGYDAYTSCSRPYRTSKARPEPPCDFKQQSWCTIPGSAYPWHAVRRFVHENQGLMRRMYGDERHISVLRAEIESNDVEYSSEWKFQEDARRRYSTTTPPAEHNTSPYFRPASTTAAPLKPTSTNSSHVHDPKPVTPNPDDYDNSTTTTNNSPNMTEPTSSIENITDSQTDSDTSTTPCISTEQTQILTSDLPTATTMETSEESTTTTMQTEKIPATMLFQDAKNEPVENSNQGTPTGVVKLRGVNACPVKEEVVAPFWANNTRGEVLALLNLYPFEQYVHWEKCTFEHKQMFCREGCRCEQQYRLHRLLAYDPNNECRGIFSDWFKFPSCCVCRCYDLPVEFQITSRSPRTWNLPNSAPPDWYRLANAG